MALRHKSVVGAGNFCHQDCNERLELLGDAVLDTVVTEYLFYRFPEANEGQLTKIRSQIVNRQTLSMVGLNARLEKEIELRIGQEDSMEKIVGNALEAWLGAIYLDRGFEAAKKSIINHLLQKHLDIDTTVSQSTDYKSRFIEWAQQQKIQYDFRTFASSEINNGEFTCEIFVAGILEANAQDRSKKRAEKKAASIVCEKLNIQ